MWSPHHLRRTRFVSDRSPVIEGPLHICGCESLPGPPLEAGTKALVSDVLVFPATRTAPQMCTAEAAHSTPVQARRRGAIGSCPSGPARRPRELCSIVCGKRIRGRWIQVLFPVKGRTRQLMAHTVEHAAQSGNRGSNKRWGVGAAIVPSLDPKVPCFQPSSIAPDRLQRFRLYVYRFATRDSQYDPFLKPVNSNLRIGILHVMRTAFTTVRASI